MRNVRVNGALSASIDLLRAVEYFYPGHVSWGLSAVAARHARILTTHRTITGTRSCNVYHFDYVKLSYDLGRQCVTFCDPWLDYFYSSCHLSAYIRPTCTRPCTGPIIFKARRPARWFLRPARQNLLGPDRLGSVTIHQRQKRTDKHADGRHAIARPRFVQCIISGNKKFS